MVHNIVDLVKQNLEYEFNIDNESLPFVDHSEVMNLWEDENETNALDDHHNQDNHKGVYLTLIFIMVN